MRSSRAKRRTRSCKRASFTRGFKRKSSSSRHATVRAVDLDALRAELGAVSPARATGHVRGVTGLRVTAVLPGARVGDVVTIVRRGSPLLAEVVGFEAGLAVAMPLGDTTGVGPDDLIESTGRPLEIRTGDGLLGRVLDGLGRPMDGGPAPRGEPVSVERAAPSALERRFVETPFV